VIDREESFFCAEEIFRGQYAGTRGFLEVILKIELQRLSEIELPAVHRGLMDPPVGIFRERHAVCAPLQAVGDDVFGKQPVKFSGIPSVVDGVGPLQWEGFRRSAKASSRLWTRCEIDSVMWPSVS
jgi:hypothetical protein